MSFGNRIDVLTVEYSIENKKNHYEKRKKRYAQTNKQTNKKANVAFKFYRLMFVFDFSFVIAINFKMHTLFNNSTTFFFKTQ